MSDALIQVDDGGILINAEEDKSLLADTASGSSFLPYLQLFTLKSGAVAEGKINGGEYGLVRDGNITSLGKDINVVVLTLRARAFEMDDGEINVVYDKDDPEYQRIEQQQADGVEGCMVGPEFLFWVPAEKTFATFFCGSKTLKREARKFGAFVGCKAMNLRSKLIESGKWKWHGPVVNGCSLTLDPLPTSDQVAAEVQRFKNPPKSDAKERVETTGDEVAR